MFDFSALYKQYCQRIYAPFELSQGERIIGLNMEIGERQEPICIINGEFSHPNYFFNFSGKYVCPWAFASGNLSCLHFGNNSSHFLGEPADRKKCFILQHIGSRQPVCKQSQRSANHHRTNSGEIVVQRLQNDGSIRGHSHGNRLRAHAAAAGRHQATAQIRRQESVLLWSYQVRVFF